MMPGFAEVPPGGPPEGLPPSVVSRHEALRTRVVTTADGPRQIIGPASAVAVAVQDVSSGADPVAAARCRAEAEFRIPFDLETGPLPRCHSVR